MVRRGRLHQERVYMNPPPPTNAAPSALLFLCAVISDALTAVNSTDADVPASLRSTSLALACTFAAPVLRTDQVHGYFQRPILGILILVVAFLGIHHGGQQTRIFDALHTTIVGVICIFVFWRGGSDESKTRSDAVKVNTSIIMTAGGVYCCPFPHPHHLRNSCTSFHACPARVPFLWELRRFALLVERDYYSMLRHVCSGLHC